MTELIWDGKYDKATGKKCAPPRIILPFQTVETVNESAADRDRNLDLFGTDKTEWRNRLVWGDKRYVLPSLLPEFAGKVNLIYIDPPFDTGANFSYTATIPDAPTAPQPHSPTARKNKAINPPDGDDAEDLSETDTPTQGFSGLTFVKEPSVIEQKAYRDTWGKGLDSYLKWFYETVVLLRELLTEDGSLYVHLDWHVGHYAKIVLDEVMGIDNYRNEVIWRYRRWTAASTNYQRMHDTLHWYSKSPSFIFNPQREPFSDKTVIAPYKRKLEGGRAVQDKSQLMDRDPAHGVAMHDVWEVPFIHPVAHERLDYPTQKPEMLLERVVFGHSNPGDLVLDCFCGSGTTAAVAEKLGRRWITCDLGRFAIHTARKRLLGIEGVKPFVVQNLGKYERQAWQTAEFGDKAEAIAHNYRSFILNLYNAQPLNGYVWLHGVKNGRMVHVGDVAAPISVGDVAQVAAEFKRLVGSGQDAPTEASVDILGWDFAFELNEVAKQQAANAGIHVRFVRIPREVLEKKAVEQGDIKFFELAALSVKHQVTGKQVRLELTDFVIPLDDVPQDVQRAITHWEQWIDYWAVDWDNKGDTFHNQWQDYRTRAKKTLQRTITSPPGTYTEPGEYKIVVKVIDILGNDTTKTLTVQVK
jgi:adenine-specific DNA-methyltransferase